MTWLPDVARWYLVLLAVTWAWAPAVRWLVPGLPDGGASVARPIGLLATVWLAWFPASLGVVPYSTNLLASMVLVGALVGWTTALRRQAIDRQWLRAMAVTEVVGLVAFAAVVWLHGFTPNLVGTEKPMDIAFLSSSARAVAMPPPDPWFAGAPINYYYLGYVVLGSVTRLAGVAATSAFALGLATVFSMALVAAGGVAFNAVRPRLGRRAAWAAGAVAAFAVMVAGNLYAPLALVRNGQATLDAFWWDKAVGIGWRASRIVCDGPRVANDCRLPSVETINEFPFFSVLLGDLHPHLMALPYTLVALTLALAVANRLDRTTGPPDIARMAISGALVGALYAMNSWDFPTYLAILVAAVLFRWWPNVRRAVAMASVTVVAAIAAWAPFFALYAPPTGSTARGGVPVLSRLAATVGFWPGERTSVGEYLTIFGVPYLVALAFLTVEWLSLSGRATVDRASYLGPGIAVSVVAILLGAPVWIVAGYPLIAAVIRLRLRHDRSPATYATALFAVGFALSLVVELFYLRDVFESRMNTLFKVYYQVWVLFAVAAAVAVPCLWQRVRTPAAKVSFAAAAAVSLLAMAAYPAVASWQWTDHLSRWQGIDGIAYLRSANPDELGAIRWLQTHATTSDRLLEAAGCSYEPNGQMPFNRASAYSGVPTLIGWGNNHQPQWRAGQPGLLAEIPRREADVARIFADPSGELATQDGITLLYVGTYETGEWQHLCPTAGPYPGIRQPGFPGPGWQSVYDSPTVRVYRRADTG